MKCDAERCDCLLHLRSFVQSENENKAILDHRPTVDGEEIINEIRFWVLEDH